MEARFAKLEEAVEETEIKVEDGAPTKRINTLQSSRPPMDISDRRITNPKAYSIATYLDE